MTEENYIEKPEGKPVKAYRARVKLYGNDVFVVNPEEPRESNRLSTRARAKRTAAILSTSMWMRMILTPWPPCRSISQSLPRAS